MNTTKAEAPQLKRPSTARFVAEHFQVWGEVASSYSYRAKYGLPPHSGDGHPVLLIPGFMASDLSTGRIRGFIKELGYRPYPWTKGRNLGRHAQDLPYLIEKVEKLAKEHQQAVSLIGWSLGGVYARQVAKALPAQVRQVITLGSPFNAITFPNNATWLYQLVNGSKAAEKLDPSWLADLPLPAPVPTTAVYSKDDGIVPWAACMEVEEDRLHQNIEVRGTHFGLGFNPAVWSIVANRLPHRAEHWPPMEVAAQPFRPEPLRPR